MALKFSQQFLATAITEGESLTEIEAETLFELIPCRSNIGLVNTAAALEKQLLSTPNPKMAIDFTAAIADSYVIAWLVLPKYGPRCFAADCFLRPPYPRK